MNATLQQRVTNILTTPQTEWSAIAGESDQVGELYTRYILPLAAIGPVTLLLRGSGRVAVVQYLTQLVAVYVCAAVIAWLAPKFSSSGQTPRALQLVAYASTPGWIAGIANLVPFIGWLALLVAMVYDVYLFYLGLPHVMKTPPAQTVPYMLVSALVVLVVFTVLSFISGPFIVGGMLATM